MSVKLILAEIDTSKVSAEKFEDWVSTLLTLQIPGTPVTDVVSLKSWRIAETTLENGD